ncbi:MAG: hypothetical protein IPN79_18020 [Saprospiraceae bacterium]|nr:hypothetical protein [Saprospiraceae bacterium]
MIIVNKKKYYWLNKTFLGLVLIMVLSCKSNEQKLRTFIDQFNQASQMDGGNQKFTCSAEVISPELARFTFRSTYDSESLQEKMFLQTMEFMEQNLVTTTGFMKELVKDGVSIDMVYKGFDGKVLLIKRIDKNNIDSLIAVTKTNPIPTGQSQMDVLKTMLDTWNKNMPMEDKASGLRILGIDVGDNQSIVYKIQYMDPEVEKLINDETVSFLKDEALRNPALREIINSVTSLGISKLEYHIMSSKNEKIATFTIDRSEMVQ